MLVGFGDPGFSEGGKHLHGRVRRAVGKHEPVNAELLIVRVVPKVPPIPPVRQPLRGYRVQPLGTPEQQQPHLRSSRLGSPRCAKNAQRALPETEPPKVPAKGLL
eukprot:148799-Pyramimonas_sp.AAC.1